MTSNKKTNSTDMIQRVATYNIHGAVGTDGVYDAARIMTVIKQMNPEILGLQEVRHKTGHDADVLDLIDNEYPDYSVLFLKTLTDDRGEYGNALITKYPVIQHIDIDLESRVLKYAKTHRSEARRAIFAQLDINGTLVWVVVTHLAVQGRARKSQVKTLMNAINHYTELETQPTIFMGDFNEWWFKNKFTKHLDDLFSKHVVRRTFPSRFPLLPLDRIWMTSHITRHDIWAHRTPLSRVASDHLPLCVDCALD